MKLDQESKNCIKYLGVLVDKNLTWKYHIDSITAKISKSLSQSWDQQVPHLYPLPQLLMT